MSEDSNFQETALIDLAGDIVSAFVSNNSVPVAELPALIRSVHVALNGLAVGTVGTSQAAQEEAVEKPSAAQIRKSVTPDAIISFVDGKTYKTMKRHLTGHGFDPQSYRQRFGLPADYPMVASNYAAQRSALAKSIGLCRVADRNDSEQPKAQGRKKAA
ncbi:MucR family transcriptional regulator [Methylobacterium sp. J-090]|uniref:MucR family transcriptional regulator n=1 Tax=Methylobacterium sp. J-090 TaxID=2836666 RepID=UPI001FBAD7BA|nr:MucR family transcriptional regulator [Methylobacterium sp. J-090]MCJ2082211.1 MucR family transcriptional regulator [Methylobacterium sp. J-090]